MAVKNVALKAPGERVMLTDLAVPIDGCMFYVGGQRTQQISVPSSSPGRWLWEKRKGWASTALRARPHSFSSGIAREGQPCS